MRIQTGPGMIEADGGMIPQFLTKATGREKPQDAQDDY